MAKKTVRDLPDLKGKRVLVRVDFNVPLDKKSGAITNDRRIRAALATIQYLLDKGAAVIAMSHLGRPSGDPAKDAILRMDKVAARLGELLGKRVPKAGEAVVGPQVSAAAKELKAGDVLMLENLRFDKREQKNDEGFAKELASLGDAYVNDAFGTCHNAHDASMVAVPRAMAGKPRVVGFLVEKELRILDELLSNPKRPFLGILGGAKVSTKIGFINALLKKVDRLLIGGKMTYTFLNAKGIDVGGCDVEADDLAEAKKLLPLAGAKIILPVDYLVAAADDLSKTKVVEGPIPAGYSGVDIGPKTIAKYADEIRKAATVVWNGPVGWFEQEAFSKGTRAIAQAMADSKATTVVGGGETAEAVEEYGLDAKMTHVSTGGGAFLAYVENPAFDSLKQIDDK
jgi:phosphoglycerate kinase